MNQDPIISEKRVYMLNYSDFLIKLVVLGHSPFIIQFSRFFFSKDLKLTPPTVTHGKEPLHLSAWSILKQQLLLKHLHILVIWGKKEGKFMIKKAPSLFLAIFFFFFWLCKWSVLNAFLDVLLCLIHEDIFLYTLCILDIYKFFSSLMFLTIILTLYIDPAR